VAGVPARIISIKEGCAPAAEMDQSIEGETS
jgi:hypothetical protein